MNKENNKLVDLEDVEKKFKDIYSYEIKKEREIEHFSILVCGYTGTGKSSIIQKVFGKDVVPDGKIGHFKPETMTFDEYNDENMTIYDSRGFEPGYSESEFINNTNKFIKEKIEQKKDIHVIWYAIQLSGARITDNDKKLISEIFGKENTLVVLTKKDWSDKTSREKMIEELINFGIEKEKIVMVSNKEDDNGIDLLLEKTHKILPKAKQDAFYRKQNYNKEKQIDVIKSKDKKANTIINSAVAVATSAGAIPIPMSDTAIITPAQLTMIGSLAALYGFDKNEIKEFILPFLTKFIGTLVVSSITKFVPFAGNIIQASVAGGLTAGLGFYIKNKFKNIAIDKINGVDIDISFNLKEFIKYYKEYKKI